MGRNDFSCMVCLSIFKTLKNTGKTGFLLFVIILLSLVVFSANAQQKGPQKGDEVIKFKPIVRFPNAISNVYRYTDTTDVERIMSDDSKVKYTRYMTYFMSLTQQNASKEGFATVEVAIDSLRYYYKEGNAVVQFDSQDERYAGMNKDDLKTVSVPLSKAFDMIYSPYGEVAKIQGEKLDFYYDYLSQNVSAMKDSVDMFIWVEGASKLRLQHFADVRKILFPLEAIEIDSTWKTPFRFQLESINFIDTLTAKISSVKNSITTITAKTNKIEFIPKNYRFNGIKSILLPIEKCTGKGSYELQLTQKGVINRAVAEFNVELTVPVKKDYFKQKINSRMYWELIGQYKQ